MNMEEYYHHIYIPQENLRTCEVCGDKFDKDDMWYGIDDGREIFVCNDCYDKIMEVKYEK